MARLERTTIHGYQCDKPGCGQQIVGEPAPVWSPEADALWAAAADRGWSMWVSRSQRFYCPEHRPGPETKMREVK